MKTDVYVIRDGTVTALAGGPLSLADLGPRQTRRVSRVKFVHSTNRWVVYDQRTGKYLAAFRDYDEALSWEREYFNQMLAESPHSLP
jgi:hypothetical protein